MKINDLARRSHVKAETIRMYREKGLLHPWKNPANGYYEYSEADLVSLLNIRKLRGANLSLETIACTHRHTDLTEILNSYQEELNRLDREIETIERRRYMLRITLEHLREYRENLQGVSKIAAFDARYDSYFAQGAPDPALEVWIQNMGLFTQTVGIRREELLREPLPARVPVRLGLGSYEQILLQNELPIPEKAVFFPKGEYVTAQAVLDRTDSIESEQLRPMLDYIKENGYVIDSDTTAFLFRADYTGPRPQFIYRLRVKIK